MTKGSTRVLDEAGFGAGALATGAFATVPGLILLYYMTDTLAVPAAIAGVVVFLPKLFDVLLNPIVGRLSDRTRTSLGARRPWILIGGVLFPLAFVVTFLTPSTGIEAGIWVAVAFSIAGIAFAGFVVPYSALPAEIAPDTRARTSMIAWRIAFLSIAILISGGVAPGIVEDAATPREGYRAMALFMGAVMMFGALAAAFIGARRSTPGTTRPAAPSGFRGALGVLRTSPPLRAMFWIVALTEIASAVSLASAPYLADYVLGDPELVAILFVLITLPLLIAMPAWRAIALRRGKRWALGLALLVFALGGLGLATATFGPDTLRNPVAFTALFVMGVGFAGTSMLPQAMFADALAYETAVRGESSTGSLVGAYNAAETLSGAAGAAAFAFVLSLTGFISTADDAVVSQPTLAITGIAVAAGLIPALALLLARLPLNAYSLTEARVDDATPGSTSPAHDDTDA